MNTERNNTDTWFENNVSADEFDSRSRCVLVKFRQTVGGHITTIILTKISNEKSYQSWLLDSGKELGKGSYKDTYTYTLYGNANLTASF